MSRSYKKYPVVTDRNKAGSARYWKNLANRKVRRYQGEITKGKQYKKIFNSWEIHDYSWYWPPAEAVKSYNDNYPYLYSKYSNETEFLNRSYKPAFYWK